MSGCEEVREILLSAARGETISVPGERFLREHVETCPRCRRQLANERMLSAGLAALASESRGGPPPALGTALLAEFRRRRVVVPIRRPAARWIALAAVAAALWLAVFWPKGRQPEKVVVPVKPPAVVVAKAPEVVTPAVQAVNKPAGRAKAHSLRPPRPTPVEPAPEVATDFFEIPYVEPLRPEQRADVFRIQVPRASMAVFGLPVAGGRLDSRISADVLMGDDGVVRAVRFIR